MNPPFLQPGDTIGIAGTARWITKEQLAASIHLFEQWGYRVKIASNVFEQHFQLAGTHEQRAKGLQDLIDDTEVKAIIISRGGYGSVYVADLIDWNAFAINPKWICGYSDITVLLSELSNRGIAGIHSTMPISFPEATPEALENLKTALNGELKSIEWQSETYKNGNVEGMVVGGNLSVLVSQLGSKSQLETQACILFLEDVDEMLYHLDRMMVAIERAGMMRNIKALIVGGLTQMKDNTENFGFSFDNPWGQNAIEILTEKSKKAGIPFVFNFPGGHLSDNRALYFGKKAELSISNGAASLTYR